MDPASERPAGITFAHFHVLPDGREVLADGRPIKLGDRAFDVLIALIEGRGAVISKDVLMARVWPGRIVEKNGLAAQIAALPREHRGAAIWLRQSPARGTTAICKTNRRLSASTTMAAATAATIVRCPFA